MCEHLIPMVRSIQSDIELNQQEINPQARKINYRKIRGKSHESIEFHITIFALILLQIKIQNRKKASDIEHYCE